MAKQTMMVESFINAHRDFITNLDESLKLLEENINEAAEIGSICTGEWCNATEDILDEVAKFVYSISEPRWISDEDSKIIRQLRVRVHDLYAKYKRIRK